MDMVQDKGLHIYQEAKQEAQPKGPDALTLARQNLVMVLCKCLNNSPGKPWKIAHLEKTEEEEKLVDIFSSLQELRGDLGII